MEKETKIKLHLDIFLEMALVVALLKYIFLG